MKVPNVKTFYHDQFGKLRTTEIDGEVWFDVEDVARALGYTNPNEAINKYVDEQNVKEVVFPVPLCNEQRDG